jgi:hypothetical protein
MNVDPLSIAIALFAETTQNSMAQRLGRKILKDAPAPLLTIARSCTKSAAGADADGDLGFQVIRATRPSCFGGAAIASVQGVSMSSASAHPDPSNLMYSITYKQRHDDERDLFTEPCCLGGHKKEYSVYILIDPGNTIFGDRHNGDVRPYRAAC